MSIQVTLSKETAESYVYMVTVDDEHNYIVTLPKDYYARLTKGNIAPEALVRTSFDFLLEREPATSIMKEFELPIIQKFFPDFEQEIV